MLLRSLLLALVGVAFAAAPEPTIVVCDAAKVPGKNDAEALVAGSDGWIFRAYTDLSADFPVPAATLAGLRRYVDVLRAHGTTLVLLPQPARGLIASDRVDRTDPLAAGFDPAKVRAAWLVELDALRSTGAVVPDLLAAAAEAGTGEGYTFRRDHHWRPEGARVAAHAVAVALAGKPALTPAAFRSEREPKPRLLNSSLGKSLTERCGTPALPPESYPRWVSVPAVADLLGDPPLPEVVLAGASNVNKGNEDYFDFAGALREELGADVLNVGVDGGGYNTGILAWMDSVEGRAAAPRVIVWEFSGRLAATLPHHFRQVVPTLAGICATPVAESTVTLGQRETLLAPAPAGLRGAGTYAVVELSDPALVEFTAVFHLRGEPPDPVLVQRGTRLPNNGRFFFEPHQTDAELESVSLLHATGAGTTAKVRWCRY